MSKFWETLELTFASKKAQRAPTNRFTETSRLLFFVKPGSPDLCHCLTKNEGFKSALTVNACTWLGAKMQKRKVHLHKWWLPGSNKTWQCQHCHCQGARSLVDVLSANMQGAQKYKEVNMHAIGPKSGVHVHSLSWFSFQTQSLLSIYLGHKTECTCVERFDTWVIVLQLGTCKSRGTADGTLHVLQEHNPM